MKSETEILNITEIQKKISDFAQERDWEQFHTPKNLAMALSVEASELVEIFQWLTEKQSFNIKNNPQDFLKVKDELADILTYLVRISDILGVNLNEEFHRKIQLNAQKYPVEKARGMATKYTELKWFN